MDESAITVAAAAGAVGGYVGQRAIDAVVDKLAAAVVRPCAERRAHAYFRQLAEAVMDEAGGFPSTASVSDALDRVLKKEAARETVYEYYRQSALSRSKETGPRLLALLAARIIGQDRKATNEELQVGEVAEACTDDDLAQFAAYYATLEAGSSKEHEKRVRASDGTFYVRLAEDSTDSNWPSPVQAGPLNLAVQLGAWAAKCERAGLLDQSIETSSREYKEDSERHVDQDGVVHETVWTVYFGDAARELALLLPIATKPAQA